MKGKLCPFRQTAALRIGQDGRVEHRSVLRKADLRQACGNNGVLRFRRRVTQGIRQFGIKDQVFRYARRIEGHARIGKGQIGRKLCLRCAEKAQGRQAQLILDVERVLQVFRAIHADPAPDHQSVIRAVDAGQPRRKCARPVRPDQRKVSGVAPRCAAADIAEGIAIRVPQLEGVVARGRNRRNRQDHRFAADIDKGLGIDRVVVRRRNLLELRSAQIADKAKLVDRRLRVSLGDDVRAGASPHQLLEQNRRVAPNDGIRAKVEGFSLWPAQPGKIWRWRSLVLGPGHRRSGQRQCCQREHRGQPKLATPGSRLFRICRKLRFRDIRAFGP